MNKIEKTKPTYCWNCNRRTGFGHDPEPLRHDTAWCTSKCHTNFYNKKGEEDGNK